MINILFLTIIVHLVKYINIFKYNTQILKLSVRQNYQEIRKYSFIVWQILKAFNDILKCFVLLLLLLLLLFKCVPTETRKDDWFFPLRKTKEYNYNKKVKRFLIKLSLEWNYLYM
jgi:hypothetical protein